MEEILDEAKTCQIDDCEKPVKAVGLCAKHHQRWYRHGDPFHRRTPRGRPDKTSIFDIPPPERFHERSVGIVRGLDELGRICLPKEYTHFLGEMPGKSLEFWVAEDNTIVLQVFSEVCSLCGDHHDMINYKDKNICRNCIKNLLE